MEPVVIRSASSRVNSVIGPFLMILGVAVAVTAVVLTGTLETPWMLALLIPAALAIGAGVFIFRAARRMRLEIGPDGFIWCGFVGRENSIRWDSVHRISPPPPATRGRVAVAHLRDGSHIEVVALWTPPTVRWALHSQHDVLHQLIRGHQWWLSQPR